MDLVSSLQSWIATAWGWLNEWTGAVSALGVLVTATIAVWTLNRGRLDGIDRTRPQVYVELRKVRYVHGALDFVVRNSGLTAARDLEVSFPAAFLANANPDDRSDIRGFFVRQFSRPISVLTPGAELATVWQTRVRPDDVEEDERMMPSAVRVMLTYRGTGKKKYKDYFDIDAHVFRDTTEVTSSTSPENRLSDISKSVSQIANVLGQILKKK